LLCGAWALALVAARPSDDVATTAATAAVTNFFMATSP
jgi:hypothetical protein